jgi:SAM-dependent methyltransferase
MTRLEKLLYSVRKENKILEIGASYNPAAPKRAGWNTRVLDHGTKQEIMAKYLSMPSGTKYNAATFELSRIEEVDYVWKEGPLESAVPREDHGTFDVCIASHVIEHTPDIVGFITSIETLLKPGGLISLAVPDKRYFFDYFQPLSSTGEVIDATGSSRHSRGKVFNASAYRVLQNQKPTWGPGPLRDFELVENLSDCYRSLPRNQGNRDEPYIDCHGWFFTPNSFRLIMIELAQMGLIHCHIQTSHPTVGHEFFVTLKKGVPKPLSQDELNRQRLDLLLSTQADLLEQASYNPAIRLPLKWKLNSYLYRFKEKLATAALHSWLAPFYLAYKHYYRDRPIYPAGARAPESAWKAGYTPFRDAASYVIRSYDYLLFSQTRVASWWRCRGSTAAAAVPCRTLKRLAAPPAQSVLFVTYHPQGFISDHVKNYVAHFKRAGYSVILIKVVDDMDHPLADSFIPEVDAAMVRRNAGYDFAAWAHGLRLFPEVYQGKALWVVNDSVFGPANSALFDHLLDRIDQSGADLVSLTENHAHIHHYQSYFLVFRNLPQHAGEIRKYWDNVRSLKNKIDVIFEYELGLKHHFSKRGLSCRALFPATSLSLDDNPTFYSWRKLLDAGFPFLKVALVRPETTNVDNTACREVFGRLGYPCQLIDQHLQAMSRKF